MRLVLWLSPFFRQETELSTPASGHSASKEHSPHLTLLVRWSGLVPESVFRTTVSADASLGVPASQRTYLEQKPRDRF